MSFYKKRFTPQERDSYREKNPADSTKHQRIDHEIDQRLAALAPTFQEARELVFGEALSSVRAEFFSKLSGFITSSTPEGESSLLNASMPAVDRVISTERKPKNPLLDGHQAKPPKFVDPYQPCHRQT